jgi:transcription initiation factor IIE alpha subunit
MDDKLRLDGNAAAGSLREIFSFEVTTAQYACEGCGRTDQIGAAMVYEVRGLGTIIRCPSCDNALVRLAHNRGRHWIDLRGIRYLQVEDVAG